MMRDEIKVEVNHLVKAGILSVVCFVCILFCMNYHGIMSFVKIRSGLSLLFAVICAMFYGYCPSTKINVNVLPTYLFFLSALIVSLTFSNSIFTWEIAVYLIAITIVLYADLNLETTIRLMLLAEGIAFFVYYLMSGRLEIKSNSLGLLFSSFVVLLMNYLTIKEELLKRNSLIAIGLLLLVLFFTKSRSAMLGVLMVLCMNIIRYYSNTSLNRKFKVILLICAGFFILLAIDIKYEIFSKVWILFRDTFLNKWDDSGIVTIASFSSHRTTIWSMALNRIKWLGNGYYDYDVFTLHNVFIQTLDTFGIIVSAMFVWMTIGLFNGTRKVADQVHRWVYYDFFVYWNVIGLLENIYLIGGRMFLANFTMLAYISMMNREITTCEEL